MTSTAAASIDFITCSRCGSQLAPALLSCPSCHTLVHFEQLKSVAAEAKAAEVSGDRTTALTKWREAIALLPRSSAQYPIISARINALGKEAPAAAKADTRQKEEQIRSRFSNVGGKKIGSVLGTIAVLLFKLKFVIVLLLTKMKLLLLGFSKIGTLLSMLVSMGAYWALWGWPFAVGFVLSIYVHEMGHVSALRHYGIRASAPMFIPFVGAFVRLRESLHSEWENAIVGLAGPQWGLAAAVATYITYLITGAPIFAAIAHTAAWVNLFNLLPIWQLDGGRGFSAMSRNHRLAAAGAMLAAFAVSHEPLLLIIGLVGAAMAFTKPSREPNVRIAVYYVALAWALTAVSVLAVPALQGVLPGR
jgi:Zn-dependent protease